MAPDRTRDTPESTGHVDVLELAGRVRSAVVPLARVLRQQTGGRLTATQASVLGTVMRHGPITISELAGREQLSLPMVSKVVAALERDALVERTSDPDDGRASRVHIGAEGRRWVRDSRERRDRWLAERLADLDGGERAAVLVALPLLERLAGDAP